MRVRVRVSVRVGLLDDLACRGLAHLLAEVHQAWGQRGGRWTGDARLAALRREARRPMRLGGPGWEPGLRGGAGR